MSQPDPLPTARALAARLLGPTGIEAFLEHVYGERYLHVPGAVEGSELLTLDELDQLLRAPHALEHVEVSAMTGGSFDATRSHTATELLDTAARHAGLMIVGLERLLPDTHPLMRCLRSIEEVCRMPARGMTVFVSPSGSTLPIHHDTYEVFTLQLAGSKRWQLFHLVSPRVEPGGDYEVGEPAADVSLSPGDVLYMPKGQIHRVVPTSDDLSLSVALSYEPPSWFTLLEVCCPRSNRTTDSGDPSIPTGSPTASMRAALLEASFGSTRRRSPTGSRPSSRPRSPV